MDQVHAIVLVLEVEDLVLVLVGLVLVNTTALHQLLTVSAWQNLYGYCHIAQHYFLQILFKSVQI